MILISADIWSAAEFEWDTLVEKSAYVKWVQSMPERCDGFSTK